LKKQDLRTGMRVTIRDGSQYYVLLGIPVGTTGQYVDVLHNESDLLFLDEYNNSLSDCDNRKYDIIKVEVPLYITDVLDLNAKYKIIWERPFRELTLREIEKELGCSVRIIGGTE